MADITLGYEATSSALRQLYQRLRPDAIAGTMLQRSRRLNVGSIKAPRRQFSLRLPASLYGRVAPGWELIQPLTVDLEVDTDGSFIVSDDTFLVYGAGDTFLVAVRDYITSLIELYQLVDSEAQDQVPHTQDELDRLRAYLHHE